MTDLLIRKLDPELKRKLRERAKKSGRSLSDEVKALLNRALAEKGVERPLGTALVEHFRGVRPVELEIDRSELAEPVILPE